jgi:shikimate kinase
MLMMDQKGKHNLLPNLYLIGFMGTGKSSVGKIVAEKTGLTFIDSDQEIENQYGLSISKIFESYGEEKFREFEKKFIQNGHPKSGCLVSCGGGLPIPDGMIESLKSKGLVICLWANVETIYERTVKNDHRPLLQTENPKAQIRSLLQKRESTYLMADQVVNTEQRSLLEVTDLIIRKYHQASANR